MGARLRLFLTPEQDKILLNLRTVDVPQKVKDRAEAIRLNAHGWYVEKIAAHFKWTSQTVREVLHKWQKLGLDGLWELSGRGGKTKYKEEDPIVRANKQADLEMLELAAATGEIDLKYLDESGFCAWSEPGYTYYQRGEQKRLEQTKRRGRRLSIIGFLQPLISFVYGLVIGGVGRKSYIQMMEQEAESAEKVGRIRVIVQDNGPIHRCKEAQKLWPKWEHMGLYIFFLPAYCSEMNPIELECLTLKKTNYVGKYLMMNSTSAYAVIDGVKARGEKANYSTQRVKFDSNLSG